MDNTYDDAYIEHWGKLFTANPCIRRVCTFEQFLRAPRAVIGRIAGRGLLPDQRAIQQRLDAARSQA